MSDKKTFTVTITRNDTGECTSYDSNLVIAAIDSDDATLRITGIDGADSIAVAAAILTLREIDKLLREEYPSVNTLLYDVDCRIEAAHVRHGKWADENNGGSLVCSECHDCYIFAGWLDGGKWNYCPNCGAKMDGGKEASTNGD